MTIADTDTNSVPGASAVEAIFRSHSTVAIMANSPALDLGAVMRELPEDTLFVFFTHCEKVLHSPFERSALLVHRMRTERISMNDDDRLETSRSFFAPGALEGEVGVFVSLDTQSIEGPRENRTPVEFPVIDCDVLFAPFYTAGHRPSSGFALALWLIDRVPETTVVLCGFTGVRDGVFRMSDNHDWTLEQTLLRVFYRSEQLIRFEGRDGALGSVTRIAKAFPEFRPAEIALVAMEVLNERTSALDRMVAHLLSVWRGAFTIQNWIRPRRRTNKF
ncbi:3-deoxy-manno-octulosonate cytidylyltransferase protein [Fulvimarina pelagi HTCC2506]|uniref:3-deoxy-manno-octulosonate cytidylyltransferase protein n=1 Tax=Fulvimarina pelagi HTCC2506 TaxID=314231 RepID=Q0G7J2_9HYPH|nr:hypothetical protein [Fulvimarina pelagi]EAU42372.1 3-deoxy-manno-octulosonate cytidylyltransferase protein [Fulvimarina pelagi HTCC2506]